jgi:hypothetical protein
MSGFEGLFRREAWQHHVGHDRRGRPLQLTPGWTRWSYALVVGVVLAGLLFSFVAPIHEFAHGVALVRVDGGRASLIALLPGSYRPLLRAGMSLRFELDGYRYVYRELTIDAVDDQVVGPAEARRLLGASGDAVRLEGPLVVVRARLPERSFDFGGRSYEYFDGLVGSVDVRVGSAPIVSLLPQPRLLPPA